MRKNKNIHPGKPKHLDVQVDKILFELDRDERAIDWTRLDDTLAYIDGRYDCSDFRFQSLIRILYKYGSIIPKETQAKIKACVLGFKYWMDEPGTDSMCYWSENHQILFSASEYLIGQLFPEEVFKNSEMTGKEHMEKSRERILWWLRMRWDYGFTEFYSNVYYNEDVAPLANLIDFCTDTEIAKKAAIIMDIIIYDIASQTYNGAFVSVSGRAYENNRKGGALSSGKAITEHLFGIKTEEHSQGLSYCFTSCIKYETPNVLKDIGLDDGARIIKASNGLNICELGKEGLNGHDTKSIMFQWGMEAFSNPETIRNALAYTRMNNMFSNKFISSLKSLDNKILSAMHLEPLISRIINPQTNGAAIQKGNTYTYKTKDYSMYTVQNYFPGTYGNQQHIQGANVNNQTSIFHCHPAMEEGESGAIGNSPSYWVSYGHLPHAVQDKNIQLAIYKIPHLKRPLEAKLLDYTHCYFDKTQFDEVIEDKNYVFGKAGNTYAALIAYNELNYKHGTDDDIIQQGKHVFYITHICSAGEHGSFNEFIDFIKSNKVAFDKKKLTLKYESGGKAYALKYCGDFCVNGKKIDTEYARYDSPYINADRKAKNLEFEHNGKSLFLDFDKMIREVRH